MKDVIKGLLCSRLVCAALLIGLAQAALAADDNDAARAESGAGAPSDANSPEAGAPKEEVQSAGDKDDAEKADSDKGAADKASDKDQSGGPGENNERKGSVRLKDLITEGFLIRTTVFVPADAVTRQTGSASTDAMVLTLQKEAAIAICYFTFKAYVKGGKGLMKIPSCTVYD